MLSAVGERFDAAVGASSVEDARTQQQLARLTWILTALEVESSARMLVMMSISSCGFAYVGSRMWVALIGLEAVECYQSEHCSDDEVA